MTEQPHPNQDTLEPKQTYSAATEYAALAEGVGAEDANAAESAVDRGEAAQTLRAAQEGWLERRGILKNTPRLTMTRREFELLKDIGLGDGGDTTSFLINKTKETYGIPRGAQYASIDIVPDDPNLPQVTKLAAVQEEDFGTVIDEGRLKSQDIKPEAIPHITMNEREFELFKVAGIDDSSSSSLIEHARGLYGIPQDDQYAPQYALINIESDNPNLPNEPLLVVVNEVDFGTVIDREVIVKDNKYLHRDPDPNSPLTPDSTGAYITVDIRETLTKSWQGIQMFASELMKGKTQNPLEGNFWLRAGGIADGQKDAYVWENGRPLASAVELTIAFPSQYDSVCAVIGDRQNPANGKPGMAQIKDPAVILTIEGEDLRRLQEVYRDLYHVPNFALTASQKSERDELFNGYLVSLTSEAVRKNKAHEEDERRRRYDDRAQQLRARPLPGSSDSHRYR